MSDITIRKAIQKDLPVLLSFEQSLIEFERSFDPTLQTDNINYYDLRGMLGARDVYILVAEYEHKIVASGYAHIMRSEIYQNHKRHAYLGFMYVVPEYRGKGINQLIMEELKEWIVKQGVNEIRLDVYSENSLAVKAYEKAGFVNNLVEMRMSLEQP